MTIVNQVQKKVRMDLWNIVRFQISFYCHINDKSISDLDLDCLTLLSLLGEQELTEFCEIAVDKKIFGSSQSVRNALAKAEKRKLIIKQGKSKKKIAIHPDLKIQASGNILLDLKIVRVEPTEV